jgi:endonuclease/exonuclease/phosphatase family metal-dependent hydrolase
MKLFKFKRIAFCYLLSFFIVTLAVGMQQFEQKDYYKTYGKVPGLNLDITYSKNEKLLGFDDTKAFPHDGAYTYTGQKAKDKFCLTEPVPRKAENAFRILSYNIHNFHKVCPLEDPTKFRRKNPSFALNVIKDFKPNIVLLQEFVPYAKTVQLARKHIQKSGPTEIAVDFSYFENEMEKLNFKENVKVDDFQKSGFGVFMGKAIYTAPGMILNIKNDNLNNGQSKSRGYLRILFKYPNSDELILLYTVHLTFHNLPLTTIEVNNLVKAIQDDQERHKTDNVIIMGDFNNNPFDGGGIFASLKPKFILLNDKKPTAFNQNTKSGETIDLIWVSMDFLKKFDILNPVGEEKGTYKVLVKAQASDHWPIYLDFCINKKSEEEAKKKAEEKITIKLNGLRDGLLELKYKLNELNRKLKLLSQSLEK